MGEYVESWSESSHQLDAELTVTVRQPGNNTAMPLPKKKEKSVEKTQDNPLQNVCCVPAGSSSPSTFLIKLRNYHFFPIIFQLVFMIQVCCTCALYNIDGMAT